MVDPRVGGHPERAAGEPHPKREVDVLVVEEEILGEAPEPLELLAGKDQAGARHEPRLGRGVNRQETGSPAPPAQAMPVKWRTPPRVLMTSPPSAVTSACHAPQPRPVARGALDRVAPAGRRHGVRVQETRAGRPSPRPRPVACGGEAGVLGVPDHGRRRRHLRHVRRPVPRRVVDDDQLVAFAQLPDERLERRPQASRMTEGDHDHRQRRRGSVPKPPSGFEPLTPSIT